MSLILEALRRSEAERRRGQAPSLLGPADPLPRQGASRPWTLVLAGLVGGLVLAGAAAWWLRTASLHGPAMPTASPVEPASAAPASTSTAPAPTLIAPAPLAAPATPAVAPPRPDPPDPPPAEPAPVRIAPPAAAAARAIAPPTASSSEGPLEGDLPLATLDPSVRASLPPLRVSMHVFADDSARRFAILDGQRLREGDPAGAGVQVLEIRRDGLRLGWQDRVLWVPR